MADFDPDDFKSDMNEANRVTAERAAEQVAAPKIGPATIGMAVLEPLTTQDYNVLSAHLASGWQKQRVIYSPGVRSGLWRETADTLDDLHRHFYAAFDREAGE